MRNDHFPALLNSADLDDKSGTIIHPLEPDDGIFGNFVYGVGDLDGDGLGDVAISSHIPWLPPRTPEPAYYIIFGKQGGLGAELSIASVSEDEGFPLMHSADSTNLELQGGSDINGDGLSDLFWSTKL